MGLGSSKMEELVSSKLDDECIVDGPNYRQESLIENDAVPISNNNEDELNTNPHSNGESRQQQNTSSTPTPTPSPSSSSSTPSFENENRNSNDQSNNFDGQNFSKSKFVPRTLNQNINNTGAGQVISNQIGFVESFHIGHVININSDLRNKNKPNPMSDRKKPNSNSSCTVQFAEILKCEKEVDREILVFVSKQIGYNWKKLARELDVEEPVIEEIDHDNHKYGLSEISFKMLEEWWKSNGNDATIGKLTTALSGISRNDIVMKLQSKIESI